MKRGEHFDQATMMLYLDRELGVREMEDMREHLLSCGECEARLEELRATVGAVEVVLREQEQREAPAVDARALLRNKLRALEQEHQARAARGFAWASLRGWALGTAVTALLVVAVSVGMSRRGALDAHGERLTPDRVLTPGATKLVSLEQICSVSDADDDLDPEVDAAVKQAVFAKYGVRASGGQYQVDYLINPQLGGTADIQNLWPEPYGSSVWNARAKDALEERLHQMVCAREVDLSVAQREISQDWIAAYRKYFHTQQPV